MNVRSTCRRRKTYHVDVLIITILALKRENCGVVYFAVQEPV